MLKSVTRADVVHFSKQVKVGYEVINNVQNANSLLSKPGHQKEKLYYALHI